jgi:hypothetical protein
MAIPASLTGIEGDTVEIHRSAFASAA